MIDDKTIRRSNDMWEWALRHRNKFYRGFKEIQKFDDLIKTYGFRHVTYVCDGGLTVMVQHDNGKTLAKVREDCYSEGSIFDRLEVFSLYGAENEMYACVDANRAFGLFLNSLRLYNSRLNKAV